MRTIESHTDKISGIRRVGLDVGSTTAKIVMTDGRGEALFSRYARHHADIGGTVSRMLDEIRERYGDIPVSVSVTGSVGMGLAERFSLPFIQEVVAATAYVKRFHPGIATIIDIGGEDAKIVYLDPRGNADLRMNGNCAGGTGAFIDQMSVLLGVEPAEMGEMAARAERTYPIASRCGVFSKTDVQNLLSKNVARADVAASIFHAVAVQTVVTLSHGCAVEPKILFCGGPLTFIPALRRAFADYLHLAPDDCIVPENAHTIAAWGAALSAETDKTISLNELSARMAGASRFANMKFANRLAPIFRSEAEYGAWKTRIGGSRIERAPLSEHTGEAYLGIDAGSTTTKIVLTDARDRILFAYYAPNAGDPIRAVKDGLRELESRCAEAGVENLTISRGCSTGYGEDLIRAAFGLDGGIIETIAHYAAASRIDPQVSFILDIGGQDMKAIFVSNGVINRMEINEACSSGCGSFIETFARSLQYTVGDFAREACTATWPCDLGTRCTVFMNSKVKQMLREGASVGDIAAGLSYSVVKNCLYKVLKLIDSGELGKHIVVQGGTMRNDSVVRALELLTGTQVSRSDAPELMGAYGCALYAKSMAVGAPGVTVGELLRTAGYTTRQVQCRGCENLCFVHQYRFANGNVYYSGNKCEKVFSNQGEQRERGRNLSDEKYRLLFDRAEKPAVDPGARKLTIGIPRVLNMYENFPFWHALFTGCGVETVVSPPSTFRSYESGVHSVMSDNICFPAKLVHSHIYELVERRADRIFFPYVVYEKPEGKRSCNSYNCPIVSGYSEVVKSAIDPAIPVDSPVITFKNKDLLLTEINQYLASLGIDRKTIRRAFDAAWTAQDAFETDIRGRNREAFDEGRAAGKLTILLAGRPYHTDPLVQHKISDMIAGMGVTVVTEDIVRNVDAPSADDAHHVPQWSYVNRILRAAQWAAEEGDDVHFMQLTSFGCGPDAFLLDEVKHILARRGKSLTLLKIDDVNNIGSIRLRVRSVIESIRFGIRATQLKKPFVTTKTYTKEDRRRTILVPYFTDYVSPLIPSVLKLAGYRVEQLPESDTDSVEHGLKYANNEVCYPATLIVGDIVKALGSGRYDPAQTAVMITQTGGQCRASNYIALIKSAMTRAGFTEVPVLSLALGSGLMNEQAGFRINWAKMMPVALAAVVFGDALAKFYFPSAVRERNPGDALRLRELYLDKAARLIAANRASSLYALIAEAARAFDAIIVPDDTIPRVGVVGEIFLKFNSFAHKNVVRWLVDQRIEVMPPLLTDFFMQSFVNRKVEVDTGIRRSSMPRFLPDLAYWLIWRQISKVNRMGSEFRYWSAFHPIHEAAANGQEVVTLSAQFGEGWLLPAEIVSFARRDVNNVISLQPFGCIANHIVSKGIEKRIKARYPQMNLLSLDFDSGVSDVNITNRLLLFANNLRSHGRRRQSEAAGK